MILAKIEFMLNNTIMLTLTDNKQSLILTLGLGEHY